jgi:hypothetical protein
MHVHVSRSHERHTELTTGGTPFRKQTPIVAAARELGGKPNMAREALLEPAARRKQRITVCTVLVGNPQDWAARALETVDEVGANGSILAFVGGTSRSGDEATERTIAASIVGQYDDFELVVDRDLAADYDL